MSPFPNFPAFPVRITVTERHQREFLHQNTLELEERDVMIGQASSSSSDQTARRNQPRQQRGDIAQNGWQESGLVSQPESPRGEWAGLMFDMVKDMNELLIQASNKMTMNSLEWLGGGRDCSIPGVMEMQILPPTQDTSERPVRQPLTANEIGLFNPSHEDPSRAGIIKTPGVTIYTQPGPFTGRLTFFTKTRGEKAVHDVWPMCLRGEAATWYSTILSEADREVLKTCSVESLCHKLTEKFENSFADDFEMLDAADFADFAI